MLTVISETSWTVLEDQIRHVPLLQKRDSTMVYPYLDAQISLREIVYTAVRPTSLYVLRSHLQFQKELCVSLAPDFDPLALHGSITLQADNETSVGLIPPIVEENEQDGLYLLDGLHRTYYGRVTGRTSFTAIHISGFRSDCPAAAVPNEWSDIIPYDTVPTNPALKRRYRPEPLTLRRDFSALNGSMPRQA
jgi:hypothetical protein